VSARETAQADGQSQVEQIRLERFIRPSSLGIDPYNAAHHDYAWRRRDLARLMSNESPLPPSPHVIKAAAEALAVSNLYPNSGEDLRARLADFNGVPLESIVLGNGSTEVLDVIARLFLDVGDEAIIPIPTYAFFETQTRSQGALPVLVELGPDFELDIGVISEAITARTKLIFLCSPNNPTGNAWTSAQLRELLGLGIPVVVDQAYLECGDAESFAPLVLEFDHLMVTRTLSKGFGLAGLRVGYAVASPFLADTIARLRIPFSVSLIALRAGVAALDDLADFERRKAFIVSERRRMYRALEAEPAVRPYPSEGNFVLFDVRGLGIPAEEVVERLQADGMLLRAMKAHRLKGAFVRLTIGTVEQNDRFLEAFARLQEPVAAQPIGGPLAPA
jgi:histidinol-phosphate aminotransferase